MNYEREPVVAGEGRFWGAFPLRFIPTAFFLCVDVECNFDIF